MGKAMTEEYTIYMDITSGDTLFTERIRVDDEQPYESQAILFSEAVSIPITRRNTSFVKF